MARVRGGLSSNWLNIDASPYTHTKPTLLTMLSMCCQVKSLVKLVVYFSKCAIVFCFNAVAAHSASEFIDRKSYLAWQTFCVQGGG